jgi:hypothetical protein
MSNLTWVCTWWRSHWHIWRGRYRVDCCFPLFDRALKTIKKGRMYNYYQLFDRALKATKGSLWQGTESNKKAVVTSNCLAGHWKQQKGWLLLQTESNKRVDCYFQLFDRALKATKGLTITSNWKQQKGRLLLPTVWQGTESNKRVDYYFKLKATKG